jgi:predicted metal-dependent hydrolase
LLSGKRLPEEDINDVMRNGDEETRIGKVKGNAINKNGKFQGLIDLSSVMYLKNGWYNLLSVTKMMNCGLKLEGDEKSMSWAKDKKKLTLDIKICTTRGVLFAVKIDKRIEIAGIVKEEKKVKEVTPMETNQCLGLLSQQSTKDTVK